MHTPNSRRQLLQRDIPRNFQQDIRDEEHGQGRRQLHAGDVKVLS